MFCLSGISDTVAVGGSANVRVLRDDYNYAIAASKPSSMTLRFLDKLFSKETLLKSTLYGTKEFAALDPSRIFAIKSKLSTSEVITAIAKQLTLLDFVLVCHATTFRNKLRITVNQGFSLNIVYRIVFPSCCRCFVKFTNRKHLASDRKSTSTNKITVKPTALPLKFSLI